MFKNKNRQNSNVRRVQQRTDNTPVFSYYSSRSRSENTVGRLQLPSPKFNWRLIPTYIAVLALVVSFLYASTIDMNPRILHSQPADAALLQSDKTYQTAAREVLKSSLLNHSKLLVNTKQLERRLKDRFPELQEVSITIPLVNRRPIVAFEPATPALILTSGSDNYVIDNHGQAILATQNLLAYERSLPHVTDDSGLSVTLGKAVLPSDTTRFINAVRGQLVAKGLEIEAMTLPAVPNELQVRVKGDGYYSKFNVLGDARGQAGTYLAVKDKLAALKVKPAEYVDVRVEEKAFYK